MEESVYKRLADAQAEMSNPEFDKTNPHFKSKFASFAAVRDAVVPVLARHGLSCVQKVDADGYIVTTVTSPGGESLDLRGVPVRFNGKPQEIGSELSYARRYSLQLAMCIVGDDDDDAEAAMASQDARQRPQNQAQRTERPPLQSKPMTDAQKAEGAAIVERLASATGWAREDARSMLFSACGKPPNSEPGFVAWAEKAVAAVDRMAMENSAAYMAGTDAGASMALEGEAYV